MEALNTAERINGGKAHELNSIIGSKDPSQAILKVVADIDRKVFREGWSSGEWKKTEAALLPEGNAGYKSMCLISTIAKELKVIIEERL